MDGRMLTGRRWLICPLVGLLAAGLASCTSDGRDDRPNAMSPPSEVSSPFTVGPLPRGFDLVLAGTGATPQVWGQDCCGSAEPFTVLLPSGDRPVEWSQGDVTVEARSPEGPDLPHGLVVVSTTGFVDYQGGLDQAGRGSYEEPVDASDLDDRPARYRAAGPTAGAEPFEAWSDLVVQEEPDRAVRVTSADASRTELAEVARTVELPPAQEDAPLPEGDALDLADLGSVDADLLGILRSQGYSLPETVPGTARSHVLLWRKGGTDLIVATLPGQSVDLAALPALGVIDRVYWSATTTVSDLDGADAMVTIEIEHPGWTERPPWSERVVVTESAWGDIVIARGEGTAAPSMRELEVVATSVAQSDQGTWDDIVATAGNVGGG